MQHLHFTQPVRVAVFTNDAGVQHFTNTENGHKCLICPTNAHMLLKTDDHNLEGSWGATQSTERRSSLVVDGTIIPLRDESGNEHFHFYRAQDLGKNILVSFAHYGQCRIFNKDIGESIPLVDENGACHFNFSFDRNYDKVIGVKLQNPDRELFFDKRTLDIVPVYDAQGQKHLSHHNSRWYDEFVTIQFEKDGAWHFFNIYLTPQQVKGRGGVEHQHCHALYNYGPYLDIIFSQNTEEQRFERPLQQLSAAA